MSASSARPEASDAESIASEWVMSTKDMKSWNPHHVKVVYENDDGVRFCSVMVTLTGGSANEDDEQVEVKILANGMEIAITEEWCSEMVDIDLFYSNFD